MDQHFRTKQLPLGWWNYINFKREDYISVPGWVFSALVDGWAKYIDGDLGVTLGGAFDIGADGQGTKKNSKKAIKKLRRDFGLAFRVIIYFNAAGPILIFLSLHDLTIAVRTVSRENSPRAYGWLSKN